MAHNQPIEKYCVSSSTTLLAAMERINANGSHAVFVVSPEGVLVGSVTDGDIRRALITGSPDLQRSVSEAVNRNVRTATIDTSEREQRHLMSRYSIEQLPLVDASGRLARVALSASLFAARRQNTPVLLMAGGLGTRLGELTRERPKPLVLLDDKPIMEHILWKFRREGFRRFFISINHMGEMIRSHFGDGGRFDASIEYLQEDRPLGTAGALSLIQCKDFDSLIVSNCDVICQAEYGDMLDFHDSQSDDITLGVVTQKFTIPFGIIDTVSAKITGFREKPEYEVSVNAGIYVIEKALLEHVPNGERFDMPQLLEIALRHNKRCGAFTINDEWIDVGRPDDLARARGFFAERKTKSDNSCNVPDREGIKNFSMS